ncbi:MAG: hypothetical protein ABWY93_16770 [Mycobacterium sp.]
MKTIAALWLSLMLVLSVGCSSSDHSWVEDEVTFTADGLTLHGTYRHQKDQPAGPAALLISESGNTDRNGDNAVVGPVGNMRQLAEYLSGHGVASLRYDKVGTGKTGLGPYADRKGDVGSAVYTKGAKAAVRFLADQPGTDKARISTYAIGEGTTHAMALATDTDPGAPKIHSLALLQPLAGRYLDLITSKVLADNAIQLKQGSKTQQEADGVLAAWKAAVDEVRTKGTVPPGQLPDGLSAVLNPNNVKAVAEQDAIDPVAEAQRIAAGTPVLLTCANSDGQAECANIKPLADALAHTDLTQVDLDGINHVLRDDPTDNAANYSKQDPLSPKLIAALDKFVSK